MRRSHTSERGFSLVELVIAAAVLTTLAGVAVVMLRPARKTVDLRTLVSDTANTIRLKASSAARGSTEYVTAADIREVDGVTINPRSPRVPGTVTTTEFQLQGGTGTAYADGTRAVVSIVMCETGNHAVSYAIVAGTAGHVEVKRFDTTSNTWEALNAN
jgi:prepilin-type N-terminal cleavage/methylation domain-containing protein